jgi:precorrin-6A/cobalt-precorrin-6A reductase
MANATRVLFLGGTAEAVELAARLDTMEGVHVITSLAGRTAAPRKPAGEIRSGGFGGVSGLADYLREAKIGLVVDATHPFAAEITANAVEACNQIGVPRLRLARPPWRAVDGDRWIEVADMAQAAQQAAAIGQRIFLATGHKELSAFSALRDHWFLVRVVDQPSTPPPLAHHDIITGRGPFAVEAEFALLKEHRIDAVVAKNSGGRAYGKIAAARKLGLSVVMVRQPSLPAGDVVESAEEAERWISERL